MQNQNKNIIIDEGLKKLGESLENGIKEGVSAEEYSQLSSFFSDLLKYINDETQDLSAPDFIFKKGTQSAEETSEAERKYLESVEELKAEMKRLKIRLDVTDDQKAVRVSVDGKSCLNAPISIFIAALVRGLSGLFSFFKGILKRTPDLDRKENTTDIRVSQAKSQIAGFMVDYAEECVVSFHMNRINENLNRLSKILEPAVKEAVDKNQRKELEAFFDNLIDYVEGKTENINIPNFLVDSNTISGSFGFNLGDYASKIKKDLNELKDNFGKDSGPVSIIRDKIIRFSEGMLASSYVNRINENLNRLGKILEPAVREAVDKNQREELEAFFGNFIDYVEGKTKNINIPNFLDDFKFDLGNCVEEMKENLNLAELIGNFGEDSGPVSKIRDKIIRSIVGSSEKILGYEDIDLKQNRDDENFNDVSISTEISENDVVDSDLDDVEENVNKSMAEQQKDDKAVVPEYSNPFKDMDIDYLVGEKNQDKIKTEELENDNQSNFVSPEKQTVEENSGVNIENQMHSLVEEPRVNDHIPAPPEPEGGWKKFGSFLENDSKNHNQDNNQAIPKPPEPPKINNSNSSPILSNEEEVVKSIRRMFSVEFEGKKIDLNPRNLNGTVETHERKINSLSDELKKELKNLQAEKNVTGNENSQIGHRAVNIRRISESADDTVGSVDDTKKYIKELSNMLDEVSKLGNDSGLYEGLRKQVDESKKILNSFDDYEFMKAVPTDEEFKIYDNPEDDFNYNSDEEKDNAIEKVRLFKNEFEKPDGPKDKINKIKQELDNNKASIENIKNRIKEAERQNKIKKIEERIENLKRDIEIEKRVLEIFDKAKEKNIDIEYVKWPYKFKQKASQQEKNKNDLDLNKVGDKTESGIEKSMDEKDDVGSKKDSLQSALSDAIRNRRNMLHMHDEENGEDEDDWDKKVEIKPLNLNIEKENQKPDVNENPKTPVETEKVEIEKTKKENEISDLKDEGQKSLYDVNKNPETSNKIKEIMEKSNLDIIEEVNEDKEEENENNKLEDKNSSVIDEKTNMTGIKLNKEAEKYISNMDRDTSKPVRLKSNAKDYMTSIGIGSSIEEEIEVNAITNKYLEMESNIGAEETKKENTINGLDIINEVDEGLEKGVKLNKNTKPSDFKRSKTLDLDRKGNTENDEKDKKSAPLKKLKTLSPRVEALVDIYENGNNKNDSEKNVQPHKLASLIAVCVKEKNDGGLSGLKDDIAIYVKSNGSSPDVRVIKAADKYLKEGGEDNKKALEKAVKDPNFKFDEKKPKKENGERE